MIRSLWSQWRGQPHRLRAWSPVRGLLLGALTSTLLLPAPAPAVAPPAIPGMADLVVTPGPSVELNRLDSADQRAAVTPLAAFARESGGRWRALDWAPSSLTPRLALGKGLDLGIPIQDAATAEAVARAFIAAHPGLFRTDPSRLSAFRVHPGLGKWSVIFHEVVDGMTVLGSQVTVLLTDQGRLAAFGAATFPMLRRSEPAALSDDAAIRAAGRHLAGLSLIETGAVFSHVRVDGPYLLPVLTPGGTPVPGSAGITGRTVRRVSLAVQDPPAAYEVDVDARTGEVVQRHNVLRYADFSGTAAGTIENPNWCAGFSDQPVRRLFVTVTGAGSDTTGEDGGFLIPFSGSAPETLRAELLGSFVDIFNTNGPQAYASGVITPGVPYSLYWEDVNSRPDERDVYFHTTAIHDFIQAVDPAWHDLDYPLPANVNLQQSCNAFWDGEAVNFFHESGNCANTGRIGDVIAHEYAHGVTDFMYGPSDPPSDLHEGNSDVAGNFLTDNSVVGPGFYLDDCVQGIRDSDNDLRWPFDLQGEGHWDGQIIAGFHWHTRQALIQDLGYEAGAQVAAHLWHFARILGLPQTQPEQVWWNLLADDDDGNMDNGTPHFAAICQAAERHGFSCPETFQNVVIHSVPMIFGPSPEQAPIPIRATIYSFAGPMNPDSMRVYFRTAGAGTFQSVLFQPSGGPNEYLAHIPGQPMGWEVDYYILAVDALGNRLTFPRPEGERFTFTVCWGYEDFEQDRGWTVGAPGDNATQGIWERCDPVGTTLAGQQFQTENDATPDPGHLCFVTGQYTGGYPWYSDADGTTTLLSPVYNLTGKTWATIRYSRWFQTLAAAEGVMDLSVSYDGGTTWRRVEHLTQTSSAPQWIPVSKDITPQLGSLGQTRFKLVMIGRPNPSMDEGGLDDFVLFADDHGGPSGVEPSVAAPTTAGPGLRLATANPGVGLATLSCSLPVTGIASLVLYRVDGTVVRTLLRGRIVRGDHQVAWDGLDEEGRPVSSGVYFARLTGAGGTTVRRLVVAR